MEKIYLYKNGVWNVGYDNTSRTWAGSSTNGFTLDSNKMISKSLSIISTATAYDLSNIAYIHLVCKFAGTDSNSSFSVSSTRNIADNIRYTTVTEQGLTTDYILDVRDINSAFILINMYQANSEIYELYLVKKERIYLVKDGVCSEDFAIVATNYNTSNYSSSNRPVITFETGYINVSITMQTTWTASCCSAIGVMDFNPNVSDVIHIRAAVTSNPVTEHNYAFPLGQITKNANGFAVSVGQDLTKSSSEDILNYSFKLANTNPWFCLPHVTECWAGSSTRILNVKIYDIYLN